MELPELALLVRGGSSLRGGSGVFVYRKGQILPDNANVAFVDFFDLLEGRTDPRAEGSLEVGEFNNSEWSA